ncbi:MAG: type IV pilin protein [Methylococcales bacterium]|nr:type IV pilin protein [Methylococcales bacterium]
MLNTRGFTLIELMIAVAVVGILSAIAYPSYRDSMNNARRADAKGALSGLANAMERHFTEHNNYLGAATGGDDTGTPSIYSGQSPVDGGTAYYNLEISVATESTYTLSAIPIGAQTGDKCGTLTLSQTGAKAVVDATATFAECW